MAFRRKTSYKKKPSFKRRSYAKKRTFKRYPYAKKRTYKRKGLPSDPYAALRRCRTNYVRYMFQNTNAADIKIPPNTTNPNTGTVQYMNTQWQELPIMNLADTLVYNYSSMYRHFRMQNVWIEITPKWNNSDIDVNDVIGEMWIVPIHETEQVYRTAPLVGFGGVWPPNAVRDIDYWKNVKGARRFTFNKAGTKARVKIPLRIFRYILSDPNIGSVLPGIYSEQSIKAPWLPCVSYASNAGGAENPTQHYGFSIMMNGWNTAAGKGYEFTMRTWWEIEYKEYMPNVGGLGLNLKRVDQETPYEEGPWDDQDDDAKTQVVDPPYPATLPNQLSTTSGVHPTLVSAAEADRRRQARYPNKTFNNKMQV